jgi:carboxylate-amine ligase
MAGYLPGVSIATRPGHAALAEELHACFSRPGEARVGIEEELMLLHPETLDLLPRVADVVGGPDPDDRLHLELPASQVEIVLPPAGRVDDALVELRDARASLARRAADIGLLAGAGGHPFAALEGVLNGGERYEEMEREFGVIARRQLVFGLHVHVCVRGADRVVAVHDALRSYLPELAALAANAPFQAGRDSGLASVRPTLSGLLPRQGVPPALGSLDAFAADLEWGARAGRVPGPHRWWWELRLHPVHGTIEVRVCDAQATVEDTRGVAAVVRALVHWLAERHDAGEALPVANTWRIVENRWLAARDGLEAELADLGTGETRPARERWEELLETLAPTAARLGDAEALASVRDLLRDGGGAARQRAAADGDAHAATRWLADRFGSPH